MTRIPVRPAEVLVPGQRVVDLKPQFDPSRLRNGKNIVYEDRHLRVVASVSGGQVISAEAINISGKTMRLSKQQGTASGRRPCIFCYNLDQPIASNCIEVPCWLIPILKWIRLAKSRIA